MRHSSGKLILLFSGLLSTQGYASSCQEQVLLNNWGPHQLFQIVHRDADFWQKPKNASSQLHTAIVQATNAETTVSRPLLTLNVELNDTKTLRLRTQIENGTTFLIASAEPSQGYSLFHLSHSHLIEKLSGNKTVIYPAVISSLAMSPDQKFIVYSERFTIGQDASITRLNFVLCNFLLSNLDKAGFLGAIPTPFQNIDFPDDESSNPSGFTTLGFSPNGKYFVASSPSSIEIFYYNGTMFHRLNIQNLILTALGPELKNIKFLDLDFSKDSQTLRISLETEKANQRFAMPQQLHLDLKSLENSRSN